MVCMLALPQVPLLLDHLRLKRFSGSRQKLALLAYLQRIAVTPIWRRVPFHKAAERLEGSRDSLNLFLFPKRFVKHFV